MTELMEETANMLRGMCMDPRIPQDTKEALWSRVRKLDAATEAALAQPEPAAEPVAWLWQHGETGRSRVVMPDQIVDADARWFLVGPLYLASPPQRGPLTEGELDALMRKTWDNEGRAVPPPGWKVIARAVERAHGIR